jgi:hypothetical protein
MVLVLLLVLDPAKSIRSTVSMSMETGVIGLNYRSRPGIPFEYEHEYEYEYEHE